MEKLILEQLKKIEAYSLLAAKNILTLDDVALLTGLKKSHLYKLTSAHQIPHYKPTGKLVYFDKQEVEAWMKRNRIATESELEANAINHTVLRG